MNGPEKIKWVIVEAIGNPDGKPGEWKGVCYSRSNAERVSFSRPIAEEIAEAIY